MTTPPYHSRWPSDHLSCCTRGGGHGVARSHGPNGAAGIAGDPDHLLLTILYIRVSIAGRISLKDPGGNKNYIWDS